MTAIRLDPTGPVQPRGLKRALLMPIRRVVTLILRPMLVQVGDAIQSLSARQDNLEGRHDGLHARHEGRLDRVDDGLRFNISLGWDYVATRRRLAALEDQVAKCLAMQGPSREAAGQMTLPFPDGEVSAPRALAS